MFWPWRKRTDVWLDGFKHGFSKAFDLKSNEINLLLRQAEETAILRTLERMGKKETKHGGIQRL